MCWQGQQTTVVGFGTVRLVSKLYWVLLSWVIYSRAHDLCPGVQVNSWPCSKPTRLSERAASISAATSSCSPQTSRWVTSASWTSLTWGIHSKSVHIPARRYLKMMKPAWDVDSPRLYSNVFQVCFSFCRGQPAVSVATLQRAQDYQCCVGTSGRFCHRRPRERRDQPVQCQGWLKDGDVFYWLNIQQTWFEPTVVVSALWPVWRNSEEGEGAQQADQRHPDISGSDHVHHRFQRQHGQG